jgi:hypothetical protein
MHALNDVVEELQDSEHLHKVEGRLLAYIVDENIGAIFRAVPLSGSVEIDSVVYPLDGARLVALALRAAAAIIVSAFKDKDGLRALKETYVQEADGRAENAIIVRRLQQESPLKSEGAKKKKLGCDDGEVSGADVSFVLGQVGASPAKKDGKKIDYGAKKEPVKVEVGGQKKSKLCVKYIAGLLKVQDSAGAIVRCDKSKVDCLFEHSILKKITADAAIRATLVMNDVDLRDKVKAKVGTSHTLFKS